MSASEDPAAETTSTLSSRLGLSETVIEVGLTHPGLRRVLVGAGSTLGFLVTLDDERITDLEVEIGLGHRGFEKEVESGSWLRALPYVSRLGHAGAPLAAIAYCSGLEMLAGLTLPDRAVWLRTLGAELARATDHWARLAAVAVALELPAAEQVAQQGALQAAALLASVMGGGPLTDWVRPGGVAQGLPEDFGERWRVGRQALDQTLARFDRLGVRNPTCVQRLRDAASLSAEQALAWSVTGPALRAAGLPTDLRRDAPYLAYGSLDFDVPIGSRGDGYDRLLVVFEEVRQSLRMVDQCVGPLASLGPGPVAVDPPPGLAPEAASEQGAGSSAEPAGLPAGEVAVAIEASTGELGFLLVSDGGPLPRRIRCRAPSFFHAQVLPCLLRGAELDDLLPTAAGLHLVSGECDR